MLRVSCRVYDSLFLSCFLPLPNFAPLTAEGSLCLSACDRVSRVLVGGGRYEFMLKEAHVQAWMVVHALINGYGRTQPGCRDDLLAFLFQLSYCKVISKIHRVLGTHVRTSDAFEGVAKNTSANSFLLCHMKSHDHTSKVFTKGRVCDLPCVGILHPLVVAGQGCKRWEKTLSPLASLGQWDLVI